MIARRAAEVSAILAVFVVLTGCSNSGETKEYHVPKALCGMSVNQDLVSKFLPAGKKIEVREKNPVPSRKRCQVNIDGKMALVASQEWWAQEDAPIYVPLAHPQIEHAESKDYGKLFYTGTGAAQLANSCRNPDRPRNVLYAVIQVYGSVPEDAPAMKRLINAYTKSVERSSGCR